MVERLGRHYSQGRVCPDCGKLVSNHGTRCKPCARRHMTEGEIPGTKKCARCGQSYESWPAQLENGHYLCHPCISAIGKQRGQSAEYKSWRREYERSYRERVRATEQYKMNARESARKQRQKWPEKYRARTATKHAIEHGRLVKAPCVVCGALRVDAHHVDYSKPLEVIWLCRLHHRQAEAAALEVARLIEKEATS